MSQGFHEVYLWFALALAVAAIALAADAPSGPWWSPWTFAAMLAALGSFELTQRLVERRRQHLVTAGEASAVQPMSTMDLVIASLAFLLCAAGVANLFWPDNLASRIGGGLLLALGLYVGRAAWRRLRGPGAPASR